MASSDLGSLAYLGVLLAVLGGWFFLQNRNQGGKMAQQAVIWALIFIGVAAGAGLWSDIRDRSQIGRAVTVNENSIALPRAQDGHFYLTLDLNGEPVNFVVDTGASAMVLSASDAERIGIDPASLRFLGRANTANGTVRTAQVWIDDVRVAEIKDTNVPAHVTDGELFGSLLGMSYLDRFSSVVISGDTMTLIR